MGQPQSKQLPIFQKPTMGIDPNPPTVDLLRMPFNYAKDMPQGIKVRVMTFNILAQIYLNILDGGYSEASSYTAEPAHRAKELIQIFNHTKPDIICLQEVDNPVGQLFVPTLEKKYTVLLFKRPNRKPDGCVIAFHKNRYHQVSKGFFDFNKSAKESPFKDDNRFYTNNICAWVRLIDIQTNREIFVYNAHTYWDPNKDDVKYFQFATIINKVIKKHPPTDLVIVCGDFNSTPASNSISLLGGHEPSIDRVEVKGQQATLILDNCRKVFESVNRDALASAPLMNAYSKYEDIVESDGIVDTIQVQHKIVAKTVGFPAFTNFTTTFRSTIDHILHSKSLALGGLLALPQISQLGGAVALPSKFFPSDHLPLAADFYFQNTN